MCAIDEREACVGHNHLPYMKYLPIFMLEEYRGLVQVVM